MLEAHAREFMVNSVLEALNWRMSIAGDEYLPNLVPEAPLQSVGRDTTRFLDYLGLERETDRPLLIVESKRPSSKLPGSFVPQINEALWDLPG